MSDEYTQENRFISVVDPQFAREKLLLRAFSGHEAISQLFNFQLDFLSEDNNINFNQLVGRNITFSIKLADNTTERYFNGYVSRFAQLPGEGLFARYHAEVVPWLWFLTRTADCRIFQDQTVPNIVQQVFQSFGFSDFERQLRRTDYKEWEYCVQYRETACNFVMRMMEQEGIFFFFKHENGKHTLVMADLPPAHKPCPNQSEVRYEHSGGPGFAAEEDIIASWQQEQEFRTGKYALNEYNFETPSTSLMATIEGRVNLNGNRKYEIYDYPGEYEKRDEGNTWIRLRMEEVEMPHAVISGSGNCRSFCSGFRFDLKEHNRKDQNDTYVLTSVSHSAHEGSNYLNTEGEQASYANSFTCIPFSAPFRPMEITPKPIVQGCQTATVVGPPGEEIYVDKYGRVKVQFHWDRVGKHNEKSSCWIRVSHPWAGQNWGAISIPRIGQEVVVDFLEGDPDRPLIIGRVYNAEQMPPYGLPGNKTRSTIKSNSSKGGGGYNEIRLEDSKGNEQMFIHAQKDMDIRVKNDRMETIEKNRHLTVNENRSELVGGSNSISVKGEHKQYCDSKFSLKVKGNVFEEFLSSHKLAVTNEHLLQAAKVILQAGQEFTIQGPGCFIKLDATGITIQGVLVRINSGGMPGTPTISGRGSDPDQPTDAEGS